MKLNEIPVAKAREFLDLTEIPDEIEMLYIDEKLQGKSGNNSGGLTITYKTRKDKGVVQKYTLTSGIDLVDSCAKLGLDRTEQLGESYFLYKKIEQSKGNPRWFPIKKLEDVVKKPVKK